MQGVMLDDVMSRTPNRILELALLVEKGGVVLDTAPPGK